MKRDCTSRINQNNNFMTPSDKIARLALIKAIGTVLDETDNKRLAIYRKFQKAIERGKEGDFASYYCSTLYANFEYDCVIHIVNEIEGTQIKFLEFASQAATIAAKKHKDPIPVKDVLKVVDIDRTSVNKKTLLFLEEYYRMYLDQLNTMGEDLLDVNSANEPDANSKSKSRIVREEIKKLAKTADNHGAAYVRFTSL